MEHMIQCRLVTGNKAKAVTELGLLTKLLASDTMLLQHHRAQLHTLLGLYAMSMNCMEDAESQFNCALRTSKERELWTFANLNLAIVYLRSRRDQDFMALLDRIHPETQLNAALRTSTERELWTFANLNLAIVYLRSRRDQDFMALLDRIHPDRLPSQSH